ncbi:MAG: response regulator transcription factor [Bacteroidales bacterium]|jgi:DNA-binding response OmpR family regulator|nr:response regulator transcription factor [Bacteroidales bacterium]
MEKKRILVVDDEEDLCEILRFNLTNAGYHTDIAYSSEEAFSLLKNGYDLLLLDIMMGGISGIKLAELIRKEYMNDVPIIFITARDSVEDKLKGFGAGADDYIPKPFSVKEVLARVQAILLRSKNIHKETPAPVTVQPKSGLIKRGELSINVETKGVEVAGKVIKLTKKEFEILSKLALNPGVIYSRADILDAVWNNESYVLERTVDVHIARLRKKLGEMGSAIVNRSGYGYCFEL